MDTSGGAVGVGPAPAPPSTFQVSQVRGSEAFLPSTAPTQLLTKKHLEDLLQEVDPHQLLDEDVAEALLQMADDYIESVVAASCELARHRKSNTLEAKDVQLHLERSWNMWIPGFGVEERTGQRAPTTEAHKQRMNLVKRSSKAK